jgi:hypothetical protein
MTESIAQDILARVQRLAEPEQRQALAYVRTLERATETATLATFSGTIAPSDLEQMAAAIEADCERTDAADW